MSLILDSGALIAFERGSRVMQAMLGREPVVVFNRELPGTEWDFLALDNRNGARQATEHLLSLGHRRIAFFGGHADSSSCQERREGYQTAMNAAGLAPDPRWMVESAPTRIEAKRATRVLFEQDHGLTAAVCYNDNVALGFKLGLIFALINVVGVEFLINFGGLGQLINDLAERYDLAGTYAAICFVILVSVCFFVVVEWIERWLTRAA